MINNHPNATAAAGTTTVGAAVVYIVGLFGVAVPPVAAAIAAGAITTIFLAVGRKGIRGIVGTIWHGNGG